ncbi:HNH endonuclease [Paenibacillus sp. F6_3S_P_1C]|uniref:HNH endonuclease n=1 Tax=Paenibacillus vandeheii TaxID=3035917 RepID=A0ABT8J998_9BACL|nr:HNH endonuclease [Paenibacillus vandeheii]MDN4601498.1 HNH endonuclease [Paenibacillus vandeheii]
MKTNLIKIKDYRNTSLNYYDFTIGERKANFLRKLRLEHPRVRNIYSHIKNRTNKFNLVFRELYFEKCAYCGLSTQVVDSSRFEVDHVIPISVIQLDLGHTADKLNAIENLVSSCQMCNRAKTNFYCEEADFEVLHPDNEFLREVFERTEEYSIIVSPKYKSNEAVKEFYGKLKLGSQLKRLDYLLMEMKDFCDKYEGDSIISEVERLIYKIESKRRKIY